MAGSQILATALSGLNANAFRAGVAANNVVNANTPGYAPARAETTSLVANRGLDTGSGVQAQLLQGEGEVDLVSEFTRLITSEAAYKASAKLVETARQTDDALLKALR